MRLRIIIPFVLVLLVLASFLVSAEPKQDLLPRITLVLELAEFNSYDSEDKAFLVNKLETFYSLAERLDTTEDIKKIKSIHEEVAIEWGESVLLVRYVAVESKRVAIKDFFESSEEIENAMRVRAQMSLGNGYDLGAFDAKIDSFFSEVNEAKAKFTSLPLLVKNDAENINTVNEGLIEVEELLLESQLVMQEFVLMLR